ncbi:MAG: hypothetical protein WCE54_07970 [Ignavibacteriaceae bacterium]
MKFSILLLGAIIFFGCKGKNQGVDPDGNLSRYPANLNYQWEYSSNLTNEYLNDIGGIDTTQTLELTNTIVKITSINDSLPGYKNLVKIEAYNADSPESFSENWYVNNDSVFSIIAYRNAGSSYPIIPKPNNKKYLTLEEFKIICKDLTFNFVINKNSEDSVQYFYPPRIVLKYPLFQGEKWNELKTPFYRDRIVKDMVSLEVNNNYYNCYVIEADLTIPNLKMIDYVSLQAGLVKREIISDSIAVVNVNSPDSAIGYIRGHDISILVNKNF